MNILHNFYRRFKKKKNYSCERNKVIALINQYFPPDYAATGQLLDDLTKRIASKEMKFIVFTSQPSYSYDIKEASYREIEKSRLIIRLTSSKIFPRTIKGKTLNSLLFSFKFIIKLIRELLKVDINLFIYTTEPPFMPFFGYFLSLFFNKPYIVILYDLYPDILVNTNTISKDSFVIRFWEKLNQVVYKRAKNIIVLSEPMKEKILSTYNNIDDSKISLISSWVDPSKIKPIPKELNYFVKENGLENKFVVLYSGNLGRCHDIKTIGEAAKNLKFHEDILFLFIGGGPRLNSLKKFCSENKLENCNFLPIQPLSKLPYSLACADLALVSQLANTNGLIAPSKIYGYFATSTPIAGITPQISYLKDLIDKNKVGKWFANGDSRGLSEWILFLKKNPDLRRKLGNNSRDYLINNSTPEIITRKYLDVIKKSLIN